MPSGNYLRNSRYSLEKTFGEYTAGSSRNEETTAGAHPGIEVNGPYEPDAFEQQFGSAYYEYNS